jgi:hypothetical protein
LATAKPATAQAANTNVLGSGTEIGYCRKVNDVMPSGTSMRTA